MLLLTDMEGSNPILTAKSSLINSAEQLPSDITQVSPYAVVHVRISQSRLVLRLFSYSLMQF